MPSPVRQAAQYGIPWLARMIPPSPPKHPVILVHDFPLRPGLIIRLSLPVDLTTAEARRLNGIVAALAMPGPEGEQQ